MVKIFSFILTAWIYLMYNISGVSAISYGGSSSFTNFPDVEFTSGSVFPAYYGGFQGGPFYYTGSDDNFLANESLIFRLSSSTPDTWSPGGFYVNGQNGTCDGSGNGGGVEVKWEKPNVNMYIWKCNAGETTSTLLASGTIFIVDIPFNSSGINPNEYVVSIVAVIDGGVNSGGRFAGAYFRMYSASIFNNFDGTMVVSAQSFDDATGGEGYKLTSVLCSYCTYVPLVFHDLYNPDSAVYGLGGEAQNSLDIRSGMIHFLVGTGGSNYPELNYTLYDYFGSSGSSFFGTGGSSSSGTLRDFSECSSFLDIGCYIEVAWDNVISFLFPDVSFTGNSNNCLSGSTSGFSGGITSISYFQKVANLFVLVIPLPPEEGANICTFDGLQPMKYRRMYEGEVWERTITDTPDTFNGFDTILLLVFAFAASMYLYHFTHRNHD